MVSLLLGGERGRRRDGAPAAMGVGVDLDRDATADGHGRGLPREAHTCPPARCEAATGHAHGSSRREPAQLEQ